MKELGAIMNGKKQLNSRRGTLLLALLVIVAVGGIIAIRLIPDETTIVKREKEVGLQMNLSHIREAIDMKRMADPTYVFKFDNRANIQAELQKLVDEKYLRSKSIKDPTVFSHLWDSNDNYYWRGSANIASNTSFEDAVDGKIASWTETKDTTVATDPSYLYDEYLDDYPNQNKLGSIYSAYGSSLKITK